MKVYVVHGTMGGFCREDPDVATLYGVYTDSDVAEKIRKVCIGAKVTPIELDEIKPGHRQALEAFGIKLA